VAETCSGSSGTCPDDTFKPSGIECRAAVGPCDEPETCTGFVSHCGDDQVKGLGVECRAPAGDCDVGESCDGVSTDCAADLKLTGVCRPAVDACDAAESCDGANDDCPPDLDAGIPDDDGDGQCNATDACTNVDGGRNFVAKPAPKLVFAKVYLDSDPGNDKLVIAASFLLPAGTAFSDLAPNADGARVLVESASGAALVDARLAPGLYDAATMRGWKTNTARTQWQFADKTAGAASGITTFKLNDLSKKTPGQVKVRVKGKDFFYPVVAGDEPLLATLVLGDQDAADAGWCGESQFVAADCLLNGAQTTLTCK